MTKVIRRFPLEIPEHLRVGQAMFNFLHWLGEQNTGRTMACYMGKASKDDAHFHLADPFFIEDERFQELWQAWLQERMKPGAERDN